MARVIRRAERVGDFTLVAMADAHVYERMGHGYRAVRSPTRDSPSGYGRRSATRAPR